MIFAVILAAATSLASEDTGPPDGPLDRDVSALLDGAVGSADPGVFARLANRISASDLIVAIYRGNRAQRLMAVEIAGHLENPWPILPYLAALMTTGHRDLASRSSGAVLGALEAWSRKPGDDGEVIDGQVVQLAGMLQAVALDDRLSLDVRGAALSATGILGRVCDKVGPPLELMSDPEPYLRGGLIAMLKPPFEDAVLSRLLAVVDGDPVPLVRGQAARLLCENALAHKVLSPSRDLEKVLLGVIDTAGDAEAILPMLGCLIRFPPEGRASLVDAALKQPDPAIGKYWEELQK